MSYGRYTRKLAIAIAAAALVAGCGGKGAGTGTGQPVGADACSVTNQKQFTFNVVREWYLFTDLLPQSVDLNAFPTATALLDSMTATARAQQRDRFYSFITSIQSEQSLLSSGQTSGFGVQTFIRSATSQVFFVEVFEGSAAADAGLVRGDELLAVGTSSANLQTVASLLATPNGLSNALGPSTAGTARTLRWRNASGQETTREIVKRDYTITPVPQAQLRLIARPGQAPVGHLTLRSFISTADAQLRSAFATFRQNNVRDVIIDLRYNGGGLVSTAELLLNLLAGDQTNQVSYETRFNPAKTSSQQTIRLTRLAETIPALRIAFITTGLSASASELVINSLAPYAQVAIVGERTSGKPVGQFAFDIGACDFRLRLVTFKSVNRNGDGDYFTGLPDAAYARGGDSTCSATDDLTRLPGDSAESMTSTALGWLGSGSCATPIAADGSATTGGGDRGPVAAALQVDQAWVPINDRPSNELQNVMPGAW
jgi:carboxyl-terminal processing protease